MQTLAVLITYFNEKSLLKECLDSFHKQAFPPDEIWVYDDASVEPAAPYLTKYPGVRLIRGESNVGPSHARNELVSRVSSQYVHFHDADDLVAPMWSEKVRPLLGTVDGVFTEVTSIRNDTTVCSRVLGLSRLSAERDLLRFCLRNSMLVPSGTYRTSVVRAIGGYATDQWQSEDYDFHIRMAVHGITFSVVDEPLVYIRLRPEGRSQNRAEVWQSTLKLLERWGPKIPSQYQRDLAEASAQAGAILFELSARDDAVRAFRLAQNYGAQFENRGPLYGWIARRMGPLTAEACGAFYRMVLPGPIRAWFRKM